MVFAWRGGEIWDVSIGKLFGSFWTNNDLTSSEKLLRCALFKFENTGGNLSRGLISKCSSHQSEIPRFTSVSLPSFFTHFLFSSQLQIPSEMQLIFTTNVRFHRCLPFPFDCILITCRQVTAQTSSDPTSAHVNLTSHTVSKNVFAVPNPVRLPPFPPLSLINHPTTRRCRPNSLFPKGRACPRQGNEIQLSQTRWRLRRQYFASTELVAIVRNMRFQAPIPDVHWLGMEKVGRLVSMSDMKYGAIVGSGRF